MAIIRMTSEEIKAKYPLTPAMFEEMHRRFPDEPDLTDPDCPEANDSGWVRAAKVSVRRRSA